VRNGQRHACPEYVSRFLAPAYCHFTAAVLEENVEEVIGLFVFVGVKQQNVAAEDFFGGIAKKALCASVPAGDVTLQIHGDDRVVDLVENLRLAPDLAFADSEGVKALTVTGPCMEHRSKQGAEVGEAAHGMGIVAARAACDADEAEHLLAV
jgi:hypothetical protein